MVFGWFFMAFFSYYPWFQLSTLQVKYTSNAAHSRRVHLNSAKVQKKIAVCKYLGKKVCVLTIHFAQIPLYINKVSENRQKREGDGSVNESPSPATSPLYKGLPDEKGRKGGTFSNSASIRASSRARICLIKSSRPVWLMMTISPTASDCQSVTIELAVRLDGLTCHTHD